MRIILTDHARFEARRRHIPEEVVRDIAANPQQKSAASRGRLLHQGRYHDPVEGQEMLLRVIGVMEGDTFRVITVYKTSKIEKYWAKEG